MVTSPVNNGEECADTIHCIPLGVYMKNSDDLTNQGDEKSVSDESTHSKNPSSNVADPTCLDALDANTEREEGRMISIPSPISPSLPPDSLPEYHGLLTDAGFEKTGPDGKVPAESSYRPLSGVPNCRAETCSPPMKIISNDLSPFPCPDAESLLDDSNIFGQWTKEIYLDTQVLMKPQLTPVNMGDIPGHMIVSNATVEEARTPAPDYLQSAYLGAHPDEDSGSSMPMSLQPNQITVSTLQLDLKAYARQHPLYKDPSVGNDGLYHCPWEGQVGCVHKPNKLKCCYDRYIDSHLKPYSCREQGCSQAHFSSIACLLRHEREAHAMHGYGKNPYFCPQKGCDRSVPESGFRRRWNLNDHIRRLHPNVSIEEPEHLVRRKPANPTKVRKRRHKGSTRKGEGRNGDGDPKTEIEETTAQTLQSESTDWEEHRRSLKLIVQQLDTPDRNKQLGLLFDAEDCLFSMKAILSMGVLEKP